MLQWVAVYNDGSLLPQYNEDGSENKYVDINRDILKQFLLLDKTSVRFILNLKPEFKLIYRLRTIKINNDVKERVHIVGYQLNISGKNIQHINFIVDSTGVIEVTDGFRENHAWYSSINFMPEEEI